MNIPAGKRITITRNGQEIPEFENVKMILSEDLQVSYSSNFEKLIGDKLTPLASIIAGVTRDIGLPTFTGVLKEFGFQTWTSTNPLAITLSINLNMRTNAYTDVVLPANELEKLTLPADAGSSLSLSGTGLIPPGPSILSIFGRTGRGGISYSLRVGKFLYPAVIFKKVDTVWNKETDENLNPISATLTVDIESLFIPTSNQIDEFSKGN